ncbi:DUF3192 domain-containing protein [Shewanella schlegeliana]|uniref:DUF3192 domain-containing protein n=1 Tax=Shewanella schlegeliana TaxID=190308 RepID=A0ABS1SY44_9GAMM|nr:DUF3192 domain-containing protein [Shewanella schlegeliana]MBL4913447.1 DUF3192 domain-containing protein [Shewanella schlegeliana]MCL1108337.1 DUF3192 domain-containing protein [Shewanella schlegeliana]
MLIQEVKVKTKLLGLAFFGIASLGLTGCVVNLGDGESGWDSNAAWEKTQENNRNNLSKISLGMSKDQVTTLMGTADFNEAYIQQDKEVYVLFYRTQRTHGDGKTTKDECTPVVISNNAVVGWGEMAYSKI